MVVIVIFCRRVRLVLVLLSSLRLSLDRTLVFWDNTLWSHPNTQTLLQSTLLTLPPHVHVYLTVIAVLALIHCILGYASTEEPCTGWDGDESSFDCV